MKPEYENENVQNTLDSSYCPAPIREARRKQDHILGDRFRGRSLSIADVGCGDGYHGLNFGDTASVYHGFEVSERMAETASSRWEQANLPNAKVFHIDAAEAVLAATYDLVMFLYFTAGNFRDQRDISEYSSDYLDSNPKFIRVLKKFHHALKQNGSMLLTLYKDNPEAENAQRSFYSNTGQEIITPLGSRFVATKEGFWSVRWTEKSVLSNLAAACIQKHQVVFHELNSIAWLVEVNKN